VGSLKSLQANDESLGSDLHREWARYLAGFFPDGSTYVTFTFSDEYALEHGIYKKRTALRSCSAFLRTYGYTGRKFLAAEGHKDRVVPHVHGILMPVADRWSMMQAYTASGRGWSRILPVKDGCHSYVTKYLLKDYDGDNIVFDI